MEGIDGGETTVCGIEKLAPTRQRRRLLTPAFLATKDGSAYGVALAQVALDPGKHGRHAAQPERADQRREAQIGVEVVGHGEYVLGWLLVDACGQDRCATAACRGLAPRAEANAPLRA